MYEIHEITENFDSETLYDLDQELPAPLDHWSLHDFADILPRVRSVA